MVTNSLALGGGVDELLAEVVPVLVVGSLLDDNLLVVVAELVDDVLVLLGELQVVVGSDALLADGGSIKRGDVGLAIWPGFFFYSVMVLDYFPPSAQPCRTVSQAKSQVRRGGATTGRGGVWGEAGGGHEARHGRTRIETTSRKCR